MNSAVRKLCLDGKWKMFYCQNKQVIEEGLGFKNPSDLERSGLKSVDAAVPGNFELDLLANGIIDDPFFGTNALSMQEFESYHSWYCCTFHYENVGNSEFILFEGIDTFSSVYLNNELIGTTDNMLIPHEIKANNLKNGVNELVVHILPACIEARKYELDAGCNALKYNYDSLHIRKAAHSFGWDIMPRIVSSGIWRSVSIVKKAPDRIIDAFVYTLGVDTANKIGRITGMYNISVSSDSLKGYKIKLKGVCEDSRFEITQDVWHTSGRLDASIENCKFWWPNNLGKANLYKAAVELYKDETLLDAKPIQVGIRTVDLKRTSTTDKAGNGEFCFYINGVKMFVMGTNWVPIDAFHSRDKKRLPEILPMLTDIGCNAVRCWGGNIYEDDLFYDFCDQNGIVIWQDFAMGCALYPQDGEFCKAIDHEADVVIKRLRNHPSIILWAGDNECDYSFAWGGIKRDPNSNVLTRRVLPEAVGRHDPSRPYLPSSPYLDSEAFKQGFDYTPEQHIWGPRDYYKSSFYINTLAHFASEVGYHGCNSRQSIEKFISKDKLWPRQNNDEWIVHASSPETDVNASAYSYRIELMANQIKALFGQIPDNLDEFSLASQISQAEALKFFIEFFRSEKWRRTGIIWWNLIDGWPQFSDAVVDYYFEKKLAYYYIKRAQQPVCLMFHEPINQKLDLIACNDTLTDAEIKYTVTDISNGNIVAGDHAVIPANSALTINTLGYAISLKTVYLIEWEYKNSIYTNHYLCGTPAFDLNKYIELMKKTGFDEFQRTF